MKNNIRKEFLSRRNLLSDEDVTRLSLDVFNNLRRLPEYIASQNCLTYIDFRKEVSTLKIIDDFLNHNKNLYVPISEPDTYKLKVSKLLQHSDLESSTYGILEPKKEKIRYTSPDILDLIIVPGAVFDKEGYRVGYGKGYYDRFLSSLNQDFTTVGICYDFQLVDSVPRDEYDMKLDYIVTDKRIIKSATSF